MKTIRNNKQRDRIMNIQETNYAIMTGDDLMEIAKLYNNKRNESVSCADYGSTFDYYLAGKLNIEYRTSEFHTMAGEWISFLWLSDKDNIFTTLHKFIGQYK
jgi:hypothetical protein